MKRLFCLLNLLVVLGMIMTACAPQEIIKTVVVTEIVKSAPEVKNVEVTKVVEKAVVVTATPKPTQKVDKVSLNIFRIGDSWDPKNAYLPLIEKATGISLFYQEIPSPNYREKRSVVMASGDYPDVIQVGLAEPEFQTYLADGLLLPLDEYINKYPVIKNEFPPEVWEALRQKDGKIYSIPRIEGIFPQLINYRKDWLEAMNMPEPKTLDEFKAYLKAVKEKDPGRIGADKLIPFVPNRITSPDGLAWVDPIMAAYGVPWGTWLPSPADPNKLVYFSTLPAFKDALVYVRGLMTDGLMDKTHLVSKERGLFKYYAGTVGATTDWPQFINLRQEAIQNAYPQAKPKLGYIGGLMGPNNVQGGPAIKPDVRGGNLNMSLTISATPAKVDAFFKLLTWQWTEGYTLMTMGVEGKSFDVVNGVPTRKGRDAILKNNPEYDLYMLDRLWLVEPPKLFAFREGSPLYSGITKDQFAYVQGVLKEAVEKRMIINYGVNTDDAVIRDNTADLNKLTEEFASKVILNKDTNVDAEYTAYLAAMEKANLSKVTAKMNELNNIKTINATAKTMVTNFLKAMESK